MVQCACDYVFIVTQPHFVSCGMEMKPIGVKSSTMNASVAFWLICGIGR